MEESKAPGFNILVADSVVDRTNKFMIHGRNYWLSVARTEAAVEGALKSHKWDVLFTSLYLGDWQKHLTMVPHIISAHRAGNLRLVICYSPITECGKEFMESMKTFGVPAKWYPYDYTHPSKHTLREL
jgi:hypothetical protein